MSFSCPHCTKPIEDVVPRSRLDEKNNTIKAQDQKIKDMGDQLAATETLKAEVAQVGNLRDQLALARAGITDERTGRRLLGAYRAEIEGTEKPPALADWIKGDGADLLATLRAAPPATPAPAAAPMDAAAIAPPAAPPPPTPTLALPKDRGAPPPPAPGTGRLTVVQAEERAAPLRAEYRIAAPERKVAIRAELDAIQKMVAN